MAAEPAKLDGNIVQHPDNQVIAAKKKRAPRVQTKQVATAKETPGSSPTTRNEDATVVPDSRTDRRDADQPTDTPVHPPSLSPRLNRKATSPTEASIVRPKPTPPGFCLQKSLEARAAEETAAKEAAAAATQSEASIARNTELTSELAAQSVNLVAQKEAAETRAPVDALHGIELAAQSDRPAAPTDDPIFDDGQTRARRKITVSAGGEALARERELKAAKALKAAETRQKNKRARAAEEDVEAVAKKKPRASASVKTSAAKRKK